MDRKKLQELAKARLEDAKALLGRKRWTASYYLCGYTVECGLKACVLQYLAHSGAVFGDRFYLKKLADCWTHDLVKLVDLAGLDAELGAALAANPTLRQYWSITKDWNEISRYEDKSEAPARALYEAVSQNPDGVFRWIQSRW